MVLNGGGQDGELLDVQLKKTNGSVETKDIIYTGSVKEPAPWAVNFKFEHF